MNNFIKKYRYLLSYFLIGAYLIGNFHLPLFEGVHFLLHLNDNVSYHSFQSHTDTHQHQVLISLKFFLGDSEKNNNSQQNQLEITLKKLIQFHPAESSSKNYLKPINSNKPISFIKGLTSSYLKIESPPPKF